jgi:HAD superfamily hydrolase (TIGR01509 family)
MDSMNLNIESMIFDLDGTLIDSVPTYFRLMELILKEVGLPPAPRSVVADIIAGHSEAWEKIIPAGMKDRKEELIRECMTVGREISRDIYRGEVKLFKGVGKLFSSLTDRNIRIGLVSSTEKSYMEKKLEPLVQKGIRAYLEVVIAIEDAPKKKPAPDPLIECARRLGVPHEKCMYVGDSHVDIRAGNAAGMMTLGVLTGLDDYETLKREHPTMILSNVSQIRSLFHRDNAITSAPSIKKGE